MNYPEMLLNNYRTAAQNIHPKLRKMRGALLVPIDSLAERRSFRAKPAVIRRMFLITADCDAAVSRNIGDDAATNAAIGAGGFGRGVFHHPASRIAASKAI